MPSTKSSTGARWKAAALLLLTLATGIAVGILGDRLVLLRQRRILPKPGLSIIASRVVAEMDRELELSNAQEREIRSILQNRRREIDRVWEEMKPKFREQIRLSEAEMRQVLTPTQQQEFDRLVRGWQARAKLLLGEGK